MSLRNPKRLVPRDLPSKLVTKARPADAAATNNIAGLEQDTCECSDTPRIKAFPRQVPASPRDVQLAGHESLDVIPCGKSSQSAPTGSDDHSCSSESFLSFDHMVMADVEGVTDFRNLRLKGRF